MRARPSTESWVEQVLQPADAFRATLPPLRVRFKYEFPNLGFAVHETEGRFVQEASLRKLAPTLKSMPQTINPERLRNAFERVDSGSVLKSFLSICGPFRDRATKQELTWEEFQKWQECLRAFKLHGQRPLHPPASADPVGLFERVFEQPFHEFELVGPDRTPCMTIHCWTALEAIGAITFLDRPGQVPFKSCELEGCPGTFVDDGRTRYCPTERETCKNAAKRRNRRNRGKN